MSKPKTEEEKAAEKAAAADELNKKRAKCPSLATGIAWARSRINNAASGRFLTRGAEDSENRETVIAQCAKWVNANQPKLWTVEAARKFIREALAADGLVSADEPPAADPPPADDLQSEPVTQ